MVTINSNSLELYQGDLSMTSAHTQLNGMMQRFRVDKDKLSAYEGKLETFESRDLTNYKTNQTLKLKRYQKGLTFKQRFLNYFIERKVVLPSDPMENSVQTKLYQALVTVGKELVDEHNRIQELPKIIEGMGQEYDSLLERQQEITKTLKHYEFMQTSAPERITFLKNVTGDLLQYNVLSDDKLGELSEIFNTADVVPSLDNTHVREMYINEIQAQRSSLEQVLEGEEFSITLMREEEQMIVQDLELLDEQYDRLKEGFFPTLHALHKISLQYKRLQRFTPVAEQVMGQNQFRKKAPHMTLVIESAISDALRAIHEGNVTAEAHEDAYVEIKRITGDLRE